MERNDSASQKEVRQQKQKEDREKRDWGLAFNTVNTRLQIQREGQKDRNEELIDNHKQTFKTFSYLQINCIFLDTEISNNEFFQMII